MLDFVNDPDEIFKAFKPYYEVTPPGEQSDPHQLYDLQHRLDEWRVFEEAEITAFCEVWFKNRHEPTATDHQQLNAILDKAVERYKELSEENQEAFKGHASAVLAKSRTETKFQTLPPRIAYGAAGTMTLQPRALPDV